MENTRRWSTTFRLAAWLNNFKLIAYRGRPPVFVTWPQCGTWWQSDARGDGGMARTWCSRALPRWQAILSRKISTSSRTYKHLAFLGAQEG